MSQPPPARGEKIRAWVRMGQTQVGADHAGARLDRYLAGRFTYRSRTQWGRMIREGRITVNGRAVRPSRALRSGDRIAYVPLPRAEPPVDTACALLHSRRRDSSRSPRAATCPSILRAATSATRCCITCSRRIPSGSRLHVVHRLDRETSGVILFGRTREDDRAPRAPVPRAHACASATSPWSRAAPERTAS